MTYWALKQFTAHYKPPVRPEPLEGLAEPSAGSARAVTGTAKGVGTGAGKPKKITKEAIFHYCYAVLHDPVYREKYAQNLKREFPRIPLHGDVAG
ncbi:type ISP restriction/modification enzyme [Candidatus Skiveiella danica]|uniref:type ISP restriction/modification enzyme n=1 Tax=Candidatus Skiveiella danica TaxID=3386177 RepID=UPI0039B8E618